MYQSGSGKKRGHSPTRYSGEYNKGLFTEHKGRVYCNKKGTVRYVRSSGKKWPLPERKRGGSSYQDAGEGSLTRDGSRPEDTPPARPAGNRTLILILSSSLMLVSSVHLLVAEQLW